MSSTAILLQQLTSAPRLNRTHGRLAFSMLLFQDLAFVPFLALGGALVTGQNRFPLSGSRGGGDRRRARDRGGAGGRRWLLRPLFHEIAHSRLRELFTLAVLLVVLASAWVSHVAGLSFALGAFLSGMMLAETEYRHQIEAVIRPFRDILLGLFFISVGMLLDMHLLGRASELGIVLLMLLTLVTLKATIRRAGHTSIHHHALQALRTASSCPSAVSSGWRCAPILLQAGLAPEASASRCWSRSCCRLLLSR